MIEDAGFDINMLYTADGPSDAMLSGGTLAGRMLSVINFGAGDGIENQFKNFAKFRQNVPANERRILDRLVLTTGEQSTKRSKPR